MIAVAFALFRLGGQMPRSLMASNSSSRNSEAAGAAEKTGEETVSSQTPCVVKSSHSDRNRAFKPAIGSAWSDALCYEARNSLQVILSGAEILLEDHLGNLLSGQKELLTKMTDNTYHLCHILSTLLGPEEFQVEENREERCTSPQRTPVKV